MKIKLETMTTAVADSDDGLSVLIRLQSVEDGATARAPLNLSVVIDRSGSMDGEKMHAAKACALGLLDRMAENDRLALVQYDSSVETILDLVPVGLARDHARQVIEGIHAHGFTDLFAGWRRGAELLATSAYGSAVCHVILLSDGEANRGETSPDRITTVVAELAQRGITTSTVGLGTEFNESLMTAMAQAGKGRAHYGERAVDLGETFESEMGLLTRLQWRDVRLQVRGPQRGVRMDNPYPRQGDSWQMPAIAAGSECWALLNISMEELLRAQGQTGTGLEIVVTATDAEGREQTFLSRLDPMPVVSLQEWHKMPQNRLVARRWAELQAAEMQMQLREFVRRGEWTKAERQLFGLEQVAAQEPWIAASLPFLRQLVLQRDDIRASKELLYKSTSMRSRLASLDEDIFVADAAAKEAAFLRRKSISGRRTGGQ